jgi:hypothetical protein
LPIFLFYYRLLDIGCRYSVVFNELLAPVIDLLFVDRLCQFLVLFVGFFIGCWVSIFGYRFWVVSYWFLFNIFCFRWLLVGFRSQVMGCFSFTFSRFCWLLVVRYRFFLVGRKLSLVVCWRSVFCLMFYHFRFPFLLSTFGCQFLVIVYKMLFVVSRLPVIHCRSSIVLILVAGFLLPAVCYRLYGYRFSVFCSQILFVILSVIGWLFLSTIYCRSSHFGTLFCCRCSVFVFRISYNIVFGCLFSVLCSRYSVCVFGCR